MTGAAFFPFELTSYVVVDIFFLVLFSLCYPLDFSVVMFYN